MKCIPVQVNKLIEYYQQLAQKEKMERDRKKLVRRRPYMPLSFSVRWSTSKDFWSSLSDNENATF